MDSTKTIEERLSAVEQAMADVPRRGRGLTRARDDLAEAAIQYARMKTGGWYMEEGCRSFVSGADRKTYEEHFTRQMQRAAEDILRELGIEEQ